MGYPPALAVGYDDSRKDASGYTDLGVLPTQFDFRFIRSRDVNEPGLVRTIKDVEPSLIYVIGWSQIVKSELLRVPHEGCVGIHPTRLPEGRGRAPIPWTILKNLDRTASTMFFLTEGVDDGDVIGRVEFDVDPREDAGTLYAKHRKAHVELVREYTNGLLQGEVRGSRQDQSRATVWPRRTPEDGRIDWHQPAEAIDRLVRAVTRPYPGAFTESTSGRLTIWQAEPGPPVGESPGTRISRHGDALIACANGGSLRLLETECVDAPPPETVMPL
jgi:methionyl-tRNA formyltransferase